ncbi:ribosome biogenesis protein SLX9 homolog [Rhynchophorus ferrugineus]|uniref:ribosome biogenesis protein SLX9 homolog n=1 Tax=Rhynchophorus ferrugineus TaxID=354439 RepID=UPI003FCCF1C8
MGKIKRLRQKYHLATKKGCTENKGTISSSTDYIPDDSLKYPTNDLFAGINIDVTKLKSNLNDDVQSIKSYKSLKSESKIVLPKKQKIKLRRNVLLQKIDTVSQMKKELKIKKRRKNISIIGDTNPLHDALPSLESLLKSRPNIRQNIPTTKKSKAIQKAKLRKKETIQGVNIFKSVLNNKNFLKNPKEAITQHVQAFINQEKQKIITK